MLTRAKTSVGFYNGFHLTNVLWHLPPRLLTGIITLYNNKPELYLTKAPEVTAAEMSISGTTPFDGSTTVTITPSSTDNTVYYTTDGTDPAKSTTTRTHYKAPFTLTATTTVKASKNSMPSQKRLWLLPRRPSRSTTSQGGC